MRPRPIVLCILDGWGYRPEAKDNAIAMAKTPVFSRMMAECPHTLVHTSGEAVGLPPGQMGNSEVGHMNIGAGRAVVQDLNKIDAAVSAGTLANNPQLIAFAERTAAAGGAVHVMGLLSPGGVHSHQDHIAALALALARRGLDVWVHAFLDGRDTPPKSALEFLASFQNAIAGEPRIRLGTIGGRYYGMDRDKRWERVQKAYDVIVSAGGPMAETAEAAITQSYAQGVTDEFVLPAAIANYPGMRDGDAVMMANFRADRARQILVALLDDAFEGFPRARRPKLSAIAGMTEYSDWLSARLLTLFPAEKIDQSLGEIISGLGLKQLRIAETEKYPHVTYFFNGGREMEFPGEDRVMVPSPKVATYDLRPEMSAKEVTEKLVAAIDSRTFDLVVVNYANPDMVGHTGDMTAAIQAVETIDACLGQVWTAVERANGIMVLTADHGNVELMVDPVTGQPHTAHTTLDVPFVLINAKILERAVAMRPGGRLADVAPTILALMGIEQPAAMTGVSLLDERLRERPIETTTVRQRQA